MRSSTIIGSFALWLSIYPAFSAAKETGPQTPVVRAQPYEGIEYWIMPDDYPIAALADGKEGITGVLMDIDTEGRISRCTITQSAGFEALDETTCAVLSARGRFKPARDKKGNAVADRLTRRIVWRLPRSEEIVPAGYHKKFSVALDVDASGAPESCKILEEKGDVFVAKGQRYDPCVQMLKNKRLALVVDAEGNGIAARIVTTSEVTVTPR